MASIEFVVISLPGSVERRQAVSERLSRLPWPWRFFDAHTAEANRLPFEPENAYVRRGYRLRSAEIGCFSSHVQCLTDYASAVNPMPYMIVLEDDVALDETFDFESVPTLMQALGMDYLRLFSRFITRVRYLGRIGQRGLYRFVVPPYGAQAYAVSVAGAQQLVKSIQRIERPIDDEMDRYWVNGLPTFALFPYPVAELSMKSTILKGFDDNRPRSTSQKLQARSYLWWDRFGREYANYRLLATDRVVKEKIGRLVL